MGLSTRDHSGVLPLNKLANFTVVARVVLHSNSELLLSLSLRILSVEFEYLSFG